MNSATSLYKYQLLTYSRKKRILSFFFLLLFVSLLAFFFANVEIQIEGNSGWAQNLPTWSIDSQWIIDIFWGGRTMTGYHAWLFSFMALVFHSCFIVIDSWSIHLEIRILGSLALFWIIEDFLWFVLNPYFGIKKFSPEYIPWHKHWFIGVPMDYVVIGGISFCFILFSYCRSSLKKETDDY